MGRDGIEMVICDRHFKNGEYIAGSVTLTTSTHEEFNLCVSCFDSVVDFINKPSEEKTTETKRGRKPSKKSEA